MRKTVEAWAQRLIMDREKVLELEQDTLRAIRNICSMAQQPLKPNNSSYARNSSPSDKYIKGLVEATEKVFGLSYGLPIGARALIEEDLLRRIEEQLRIESGPLKKVNLSNIDDLLHQRIYRSTWTPLLRNHPTLLECLRRDMRDDTGAFARYDFSSWVSVAKIAKRIDLSPTAYSNLDKQLFRRLPILVNANKARLTETEFLAQEADLLGQLPLDDDRGMVRSLLSLFSAKT